MALYFVFTTFDIVAHRQDPTPLARPKAKRPPDNGKLFNSDGSPARTKKRTDYSLEWFDYDAYGGTEEYAADVLDDFYEQQRLGFAYQPWVQFSEPEFNGKLTHVDRDARGFLIRRTVNPEANGLPVAHVFLLGGSTTFGSHVSDEHTWASYFSTILNERSQAVQIDITNYGHAFFNPSQEAVLLAALLKSGHRPSLVVFMDGVNNPSSSDIPNFTPEIVEAVRNVQFPPSYLEQWRWVPVIRLTDFLRRRWTGATGPATTMRRQVEDKEVHIQTAINAFRQSRDIARAIAKLYDVPTLFFLQPNSLYNYDVSLFRIPTVPQWFLDDRQFATGVYRQLKTDHGYVDLSGLFDEWGHRKAMVDDVHYTPAFNQFLAQRVSASIDIKSLKPRAIDEKAATGVPH